MLPLTVAPEFGIDSIVMETFMMEMNVVDWKLA